MFALFALFAHSIKGIHQDSVYPVDESKVACNRARLQLHKQFQVFRVAERLRCIVQSLHLRVVSRHFVRVLGIQPVLD